MEPRIQYANAADGVSIAFSAIGQGPALVYMPSPPWGHVQLEWQNPEWRRWYEFLAEKRQLVQYDPRGCGLSDRDVADISLGSYLLDLEAVVGRLGLERFAVFAPYNAGPPAVAYAAHRAERISHLILWCSYGRYSDVLGSPEIQAFHALRSTEWNMYTETVAQVVYGWSAGEPARRFAKYLRAAATPEVAGRHFDVIRDVDVVGLLQRVTSPTLVLHRAAISWLPVDLGKGLASRIPNARLLVLEGMSASPFVGDYEAAARAIDEVLGEGDGAATAAPGPSGLVTILFTDMESSTAVRQRLGDAKAQELLRAHNSIVRDALKAHGGSEIKHTGDGIMASFTSAFRSLDCAVAIQRGVAAHVEEHAEAPLRVYIGLNAGEPIAEEDDLFGTSVDLAKRICDQAEAGQILVSDVVRQLAAGKGFLFSDRGEVALRGFEDPVRLYDVRWREEA